MQACESCHALTGSLTAILAETINENCVGLLTVYCSIGGVVALTVLLECHTDCSIRVYRSWQNFQWLKVIQPKLDWLDRLLQPCSHSCISSRLQV